MSPASQWRPNPNVVFTKFDDLSAALLHLDTKRYYSLNETALRIWELMAAGGDLASIAAAIQREFEIDLADAEARIAAFMEDLEKENLVEVIRA